MINFLASLKKWLDPALVFLSFALMAFLAVALYPLQGYPYQDTARILMEVDADFWSILQVHNAHFIPLTKFQIFLEADAGFPPNTLGIGLQFLLPLVIVMQCARIFRLTNLPMVMALFVMALAPIAGNNPIWNIIAFGEVVSLCALVTAIRLIEPGRWLVIAILAVIAATTHGIGWVICVAAVGYFALLRTGFGAYLISAGIVVLAVPFTLLIAILIVSYVFVLPIKLGDTPILIAAVIFSGLYSWLVIKDVLRGACTVPLLMIMPMVFAFVTAFGRLELSDLSFYIHHNTRYAFWGQLAVILLIMRLLSGVTLRREVLLLGAALLTFSHVEVYERSYKRFTWWETNMWAPAMQGYAAGLASEEVLRAIARRNPDWVAYVIDKEIIDVSGLRHETRSDLPLDPQLGACPARVTLGERFGHDLIVLKGAGSEVLFKAGDDLIYMRSNSYAPEAKALGKRFIGSFFAAVTLNRADNIFSTFIDRAR